MDRTEKREFVSSLAAVFADTSMVVVTQNKGLTVAEVTVLRQRMRAAGATFKVAKNRLAILALDGTSFDGIKPLLKGPTALAWSRDPVAVAKAAVDFAKTNDKLVLLGGALGTQTLDADGIRALAELPSLDALRSRLLGMIQTPATRIASVVAAPAAGLARVIGAYARKEGGPDGPTGGADGAPTDGAPEGGAPEGGAPTGGAPEGGAPVDAAPTDGAPADAAPTSGAATGGASTEAPAGGASAEALSGASASGTPLGGEAQAA